MLMMWTTVDGNDNKVIRMPYIEIDGREYHAPLFMLEGDVYKRRGLRTVPSPNSGEACIKTGCIKHGATVKVFLINQTMNIHQWDVLVPGMNPEARISLSGNRPSHIRDYVTIHSYSASFSVYDHYIENAKQWLQFINDELSAIRVKQIEKFMISYLRNNGGIDTTPIKKAAATLEKIKSRMLHPTTIKNERLACEHMYRNMMIKVANKINLITGDKNNEQTN